jgi:hypothetical protein
MTEDDLKRALAFIGKKGTLRTEAVARHLGATEEAADVLLQPAVDSGYLVCCLIRRPGRPDQREYRISLGADLGRLPAAGAFVISNGPRAAAARAGFRFEAPPRTPVNHDFKAIAPSEQIMSRDKCITRQQVLAYINESGSAGISRKNLIEHFGVPAANIDMHLTALRRASPPAIFSPERGLICASDQALPARIVSEGPAGKAMHATREAVMRYLGTLPTDTASMSGAISEAIGCSLESTRAVLGGLFAGLKVDRSQVGDDWAYFLPKPLAEVATPTAEAAVETIEIVGVQETTEALLAATVTPDAGQEGGRKAFPSCGAALGNPGDFTHVVLDDADATMVWIFSSGAIEIFDESLHIQLNPAVAKKLLGFLGLFMEAA